MTRPDAPEMRLLKGNPGKRPAPPAPLGIPLDAPPPPPSSLGVDGLEAWGIYWHGAGTWLTESDVPSVRRLCALIDQVARLDGEISRCRAQNKRIYLMNSQRGLYRDIMALEDRCGLNPSARARIRVEKPQTDPGEAWLRNRRAKSG